jgi:hypothetical protein
LRIVIFVKPELAKGLMSCQGSVTGVRWGQARWTGCIGGTVAERQGLGALLPQEVWQALLASGTVRRFDGGEVLMLQGDPGTMSWLSPLVM